MIDWKGNIVEKKYRKHVIIEDIEEDPMMLPYIQVRSIEYKALDNVFDRIASDDHNPGTCHLKMTKQADEVGNIPASVDPLLNDKTLYQRMSNRADLGKYHMEQFQPLLLILVCNLLSIHPQMMKLIWMMKMHIWEVKMATT